MPIRFEIEFEEQEDGKINPYICKGLQINPVTEKEEQVALALKDKIETTFIESGMVDGTFTTRPVRR